MNMLVNSPKDQTPQKLYLRIYRPLLSKKKPIAACRLHCCIETNHKTSERLQALRQMRKQGNETQNFTINTPHQLSNYDQKTGHSAEQWSQAQKRIYNRIAEKRKKEGAAMAQSRIQPVWSVVAGLKRELCMNHELKYLCKEQQAKIPPQCFDRLIKLYSKQLLHVIADKSGSTSDRIMGHTETYGTKF